MKVVHVFNTLDYGGVESVGLSLVRGLTDMEHSVVSLTLGEQPRDAEFEEVSALHKCPYVPGRRRELVGNLRDLFRSLGPDRVLAHSFGNHALVALSARLANVPRTFGIVSSSPLRTRAARKKTGLLAHLARPFCSGEIAVSETVARELREGLHLPARRVRVIFNGVDVAEFRMRARRARSARSDDRHRIVMVSRMDDAKDHPTLLRAISETARQDDPIELLLVGDGPMRTELELLARQLELENHVQFTGARTDVPELMGGADLLVHATQTEGFAIVVAEAMAAGVPVIAADVPACREVLGDAGHLYAPGRSDRLAAAILELLSSPSLRDSLAARGQERAESFDVGLMIGRYRELLLAEAG